MQDLNGKITGNTLTAAEWNEVPSEIQNVIEALGLTLSSGDLNQLGKAIAGYVANGTFYTDSGIANAYVLTKIGLKQTATAYTDGFFASFIAGNSNSSASTVNVAGLGVKNIVLPGGVPLLAGDISGRVELAFDNANDRFELLNARIDKLTPATLAIAVADARLEVDDVVNILDTSQASNFGGFWELVLASGITDNGDNKILSTGGQSPALALVKIERPLVYDIVITYGQSGSIGFAGQPGVPAVDDASTPTANVFAKNYDPDTDTIIPISNTMNHLNFVLEGSGSRGNAWTAFANTWYDLTGNGLIILNAGRGSASISQLQKGNTNPVSPDSVPDADYYQRMIDGYADTKTAMATQGYDIGRTYCVFHQGEADQQTGLNPVSYRNDLKQLALDMFVDITELNKFGVIIVGNPGSRPLESWQNIQSAQWSAVNDGVGGDIGRNMVIVYDGTPSFTLENGQYNIADDTHYSQRGYNEMGIGSARGLHEWVSGNIDITGNEANSRDKGSVTGAGKLSIRKISEEV